jgi:hypothetical protein
MEVYTQLYANCDKILDVLATNPHHRMMESDIYSYADEQQRPRMRAALIHLSQYGMIKEDPHPHYILLGPGSTLQATGGYKNKFEEENKQEEEGGKIAALTIKNAQSVIDTNTSIQVLNTKTDTFYTKQTRYNNIQIFLTIAILLSSAIYTTVAVISHNESKQNSLKEQRLEELEKTLKYKTTKDSLFQKVVKDSLKMK